MYKKSFISLNLKKISLLLIVLIIALTSNITWLYFHNYSPVIENQIYRSRQLTNPELKKLIIDWHIRSIINLRGANPNELWYQDEIKLSQQLKIQHNDIALQSKRMPKAETIWAIENLLETLPKPILIHCESGVDRTGFASAIALIVLGHPSLNDVKKQVSWRYFVFSNQSVGKQFAHQYQAYLDKNRLDVNKESFNSWLISTV